MAAARRAALGAWVVVALAIPAQASPPTASALDAGIAKAIHADVAASVILPSGDYAGDALWVFGDTTQVNGKSTICGDFYPHDAFAVQRPGSTTWTVLTAPSGVSCGGGIWQQVPNFSNGDYFWASGILVDGSTVYVLGNRVLAGTFNVAGPYVARFSVSELAYQGINALPDPAPSGQQESWSGAAKATSGWWIAGSHGTGQSGCLTDCKVGDMAFVPFGHVATASDWQVHGNVFPASLNCGTIITLDNTGSGWVAYTKLDDILGTNIGRLSASSPTGTWSVTGTYPAPSVLTSGATTYDAQVHPEQHAASGQVLVAVAENDSGAYDPQFTYLPLSG